MRLQACLRNIGLYIVKEKSLLFWSALAWPDRESLRSRRRLVFLERQAEAAPGGRTPKS